MHHFRKIGERYFLIQAVCQMGQSAADDAIYVDRQIHICPWLVVALGPRPKQYRLGNLVKVGAYFL